MEIRRPKYSPVIRFNRLVTSSFIGRLFRLEGSSHPEEIAGTTFLNELRAGTTTFAAMAYIIAVNASILSQTGGPCICDEKNRNDCDKISSYATCKEEVRRDLVMATSVMAALSSFMFGLTTNLPIALALGMGLNAYFAFHVVGCNGSGKVPYGVALTAVFLEGLIFIFFALTGLRQWLVKLIPSTIKIATGAGIYLFLAEIGLSYGSGIEAITGGWNATPLTIAGCPIEMIKPPNRDVRFWDHYKSKEGDFRFDLFRQVRSLYPMEHTFNALDWEIAEHGTRFVLTLFTFFGAGIAAGGRTGITAMATGALFLVAVMFGPIFSSVPPWATGPTLILVGCLMARQMTEINWRYIGDTLPSFVVIAFVPFSFNVAYGIIALSSGMFLYATINILVTLTVRISGGTLEPENYNFKEYWTWKAPRDKPWYIRMFRNSDVAVIRRSRFILTLPSTLKVATEASEDDVAFLIATTIENEDR
ncbi:hypothetical protein FAUST_9636 [Fusarium austroamericanum]|uniref:Xanthine/uracil permease n=1 Tax=Fusarium austroamericanum TaxID=282268 RepID=A0AAN6BWT2_FUSAU|nr:hypothetical protein FAUST_9636 [Fusarium austroamericanum]